MKRPHKIFYLFIVLVFLLAACGTNEDQTKEKAKNSDKQSYDRIISLMPSNTEILYELGLGNNIVGVSTVDDYPQEVKDKQQFDAMKLNKESLLKAKPDLILAHESQKSTSSDILNTLKDSGVKIVYVKDAQSITEMYSTFKPNDLARKSPSCNNLILEIMLNKIITPMSSTVPMYTTSLYSAEENPPNI